MARPAVSLRRVAAYALALMGGVAATHAGFAVISTRLTRGCTMLAVACALAVLLLVLVRSRRSAAWAAAATALAGALLLLPGGWADADSLRSTYLERLASYEGTSYLLGGESRRSIDCSGLPRRAWIEALLRRAVAQADPSLARHALRVWWRDQTADEYGREVRGFTVAVTEASSLNALDARTIEPGDLAVTADGRHLLVYLGAERWIQAEPRAGGVIILATPQPGDPWFDSPARIVRWRLLAD